MAEIQNGDFVLKDSGTRQEFPTGARRDMATGKGRYDLLPPTSIARLAKIFEAGAVKYGDRNFEKGMPLTRFIDSALRHTFQYLEGKKDEDHLMQAAWNLMACCHIEELVKRGVLPAELNDLPCFFKKEQKT